jgi:WD40 repeat protein
VLSSASLLPKSTLDGLFQPITFTDNDKQLIAFSSDWSIWKADLETQLISLIGRPIPQDFSVVTWALAPNSTKIALSDENGSLALVEVASSKSWLAQDSSGTKIWGIAFTQDSQEVWTGSADGMIRRWDATDATLLGPIAKSEPEIQAMAVSPDKQWLAVSIFGDSSLRLLNLKQNRWLRPRHQHRRYIQNLFFASQGRRLVSAGVDGRIVIWSVPDFEAITAFDVSERRNPSGDEGIAVCKISPNEAILTALTEDGHLQAWRTR